MRIDIKKPKFFFFVTYWQYLIARDTPCYILLHYLLKWHDALSAIMAQLSTLKDLEMTSSNHHLRSCLLPSWRCTWHGSLKVCSQWRNQIAGKKIQKKILAGWFSWLECWLSNSRVMGLNSAWGIEKLGTNFRHLPTTAIIVQSKCRWYVKNTHTHTHARTHARTHAHTHTLYLPSKTLKVIVKSLVSQPSLFLLDGVTISSSLTVSLTLEKSDLRNWKKERKPNLENSNWLRKWLDGERFHG